MPKESSDPGHMSKALHASVTGIETGLKNRGSKLKKKYTGKLDKFKKFSQIIKGSD